MTPLSEYETRAASSGPAICKAIFYKTLLGFVIDIVKEKTERVSAKSNAYNIKAFRM